MKREFVYMKAFEKGWYRLGLGDTELSQLENFIMENPGAGIIMEGTGGLKKIRWSLPNQGKSGSIRVLYIDFIFDDTVFVISLFPKNEKENLSQTERFSIKQMIKAIAEELRK